MKLKVKDMDIATGDILVVILNEQDASMLDLHHGDRILIVKGERKITAVMDVAESKKAVPPGSIGMFEEVLDALHAKQNDEVTIKLAKKPISVTYLRKKLDGKELSYKEITEIISDIGANKLTDIELTSFVTANYIVGMTDREIVDLTKAMTLSGSQLRIAKRPVVDLHSIGGVPGNRTTIIMVPILVAAGLIVPKTSSRAITSPAGTADTMEVFAPVSLPMSKLYKLIDEVGGFMIWGGSVNLAPADDRIIKVEHPLSIDAEGQMLASIMAKKASVSTTHLLMEIPIGKGAKVPDKKKAAHLQKHFENLSKELGIKILVVVTDGSQPIGNGIGPILEAKDCLRVLQNDPKGPKDLRDKSLELAGKLLEFAGKAKKGKGLEMATKILESGKAYDTFEKMVKAQGGKVPKINELKTCTTCHEFKADRAGTLSCLDNVSIARIARMAGAPKDKDAGVYLHKHCGDKVRKGETIMTIYAHGKTKLGYALELLEELDGIIVK